jgi:sugar lactone lactonase YvrE
LVPLLPAATGDTVADQVLGQPDFVHESANTVDGASMSAPDFVAVDITASPNHLYLADTNNNRVLGWNNAASFTNGAAADLVIGQPDFFSSRINVTNGQPGANTLWSPTGVAVDSNGNLYVADSGNNRVLEYAAPFSACKSVFPCVNQGASTVFGQLGDFAGSGCNFQGFTLTPDADSLCGPSGVALDSHDNLYIADFSNNRVLEYITPLTASATAGSGDMTADLVFGQGASGTAFTVNASNNGGISGTSLSGPRGVAVDGSDNVYISDTGNNRVLEFAETTNPPANVTSLLVIGQSGLTTGGCGGLSNLSGLCQPFQLALDAANNLYVADRGDNRALEYSTPLSTGMTANLAFRGLASDCVNGPLTASTLCAPQGIAVDSAGDVFVGDTNDNRVTKFNIPLSTDTVGDSVLGQGDFTHHAANSVDADGVWSPTQVAVDRASTPNRLYLADSNNSRVLGWSDAASFTNGAPADLVLGQPDFFSGAGNNGAATPSATTLSGPAGVAVDSKGNLYVSDMGNNRVLEYTTPFTACVSPPCVANKVFGQAIFTTSACAAVSATSLCVPRGLALDGNDDLYVTDSANNRVLEYITPLTSSPTAGSGDTTADLVFGQGASGTAFTANTSNNGGISGTSLDGPRGVAVDGSNNLYVSDTLNNRVLEYNEAANPPANVIANQVFGQGGVLTTKACNSPVSANTLCSPQQVVLDSANNLWVADTSEGRVLEFNTPFSTDTTADRVFGQADSMEATQCNFGNPNAPAAATLCDPTGVAIDSAGDLFIADNANNRVLRYNQPLVATPTPSPTPTPGHTPTPTPSPAATPTPTPGVTPTPIPSPTPTPAFAGTLSVATPELFGSVGIGASKNELLAIHNLSPRKTMKVSLNAVASPFGVLSGLGPFEIAPLHKTTVKLQFAPTAPGKATGTLNIASTDPHHSTFKVTLIGHGVAGHLVVNLAAPISPARLPTLGFGKVKANRTLTKRFTVTNSALGVLNGSVATFAGGSPFSVTQGAGPFTLQPHKSLTIGVRFAPIVKGKKTDTLVIIDTAPGTPATVDVAVSGNGS